MDFKNKLTKIKNKIGINKKKKRNTICIVGMSAGIGVTHTSIALANYLHSVQRKNVVYIELTDQSCLMQMFDGSRGVIKGIPTCKYKGVDYITNCTVREAGQILAFCKEDVIVDMKELTDETKDIFLQCDTKIVVGSLQPWLENKCVNYIRKILKICDAKIIKWVTINKINKKKNYILSRLSWRYMPYIENPFLLEEEHFEKLHNIIA